VSLGAVLMSCQPVFSLTSAVRGVAGELARTARTELKLEPEEHYREACEDEGGRRYIVIVWRPIPGLSLTEYTRGRLPYEVRGLLPFSGSRHRSVHHEGPGERAAISRKATRLPRLKLRGRSPLCSQPEYCAAFAGVTFSRWTERR
jgi:hypothetical protein